MITLKGTPKHPGIAIAMAAVVDFSEATPSLSYSTLQKAAAAVKRQLLPADQPEVVMVSEQLFFGATLKVPGLQKAALIAESDDEAAGLAIGIPCVVGVTGALELIPNETIVIVDGYTGTVVVDPDVHVLVDYQREIEERHKRARVFLDSAHLPAETVDGRQITVAARVKSLEDVQSAVTHGADTIVAEIQLSSHDCQEFISTAMASAAGTPVTLVPNELVEPLLGYILRLSIPGQLTIAFPGSRFAEQRSLLQDMMESLRADTPPDELPTPKLAVVAHCAEDTFIAKSASVSVILDRPDEELEGAVRTWLAESKASRLMVGLRGGISMLPKVIEAGALSIAVEPEWVQQAKDMIRGLGGNTIS